MEIHSQGIISGRIGTKNPIYIPGIINFFPIFCCYTELLHDLRKIPESLFSRKF